MIITNQVGGRQIADKTSSLTFQIQILRRPGEF